MGSTSSGFTSGNASTGASTSDDSGAGLNHRLDVDRAVPAAGGGAGASSATLTADTAADDQSANGAYRTNPNIGALNSLGGRRTDVPTGGSGATDSMAPRGRYGSASGAAGSSGAGVTPTMAANASTIASLGESRSAAAVVSVAPVTVSGSGSSSGSNSGSNSSSGSSSTPSYSSHVLAPSANRTISSNVLSASTRTTSSEEKSRKLK